MEQSDTHSSSSLSISNDPFGYSDEYTDSESNLQYLQARYYNPVMMRFTEMDTYPLLNRYSYADENPVMNDDPTGHSSQSTLGSVGGIVGDVGMGLGSLGSIGSIVAGALTGNPMAIIGGIMGLTSIGLGVGSQETDNSALRLGLGISSLVVGMSAMAVDYAVGTSTVAKSSNAANSLMLSDDDTRASMQ